MTTSNDDGASSPKPTAHGAPEPSLERGQIALAELDKIVASMERRFQEGRRVLSFQEYLELFAQRRG